MSDGIHPMAPHALPSYFAAADGSDPLFTFIVFFVFGLILLFGVGYFSLHALPEKMAHKDNSTQLQLVSILALIALFTHNNIFWIAALLLAALRPPDFSTPLNSMARSLEALTRKDPQ